MKLRRRSNRLQQSTVRFRCPSSGYADPANVLAYQANQFDKAHLTRFAASPLGLSGSSLLLES